ncbi:hypothetical protein [Thauera sp.]|uniref:hypothetical protein n=1 Tax=Thauera sp. TaxID=1905334 RepID=UPI0039E4861E
MNATAMTAALRREPLLAGLGFGLAVVLVLNLVIGLAMNAGGLPLKPLAWFDVALLLVAGPQAAVHLAERRARQHGRQVIAHLSWRVMLPFVLLNLGAVLAWFLWGAAWVARIDARPVAAPLDEAALRQALVAWADGGELPVQWQALPDGTLAIAYDLVDARWTAVAQAGGHRHTQRLLFSLDAARRSVRVREQVGALEWRAGVGAAALHWQESVGISFFHSEQRAGPGNGPLRLDHHTLKRPLTALVTDAGWHWQPTLLPRSLPLPATWLETLP